MKFKVLSLLCGGLLLFTSSTGLIAQETGSIQIKGSDTMVNLGQAWAETFMQEHPEAFIAVTGGGSGTGMASLINGTCDIAQASRDMSEKEYEMAESKGLNVQEIKVAIDAVVIVVNPENPVNALTIDQLSDIFTGKVTNWKEVGGPDQPILVLSRDRNSGTHIFLLEHVVRKEGRDNSLEFAPSVLMMPSSQAIEQEVAGNPAAIGYFGMGYISDRIKSLAVQSNADAPVEPTLDTVSSGLYPVSRPLLFYLPKEPGGIVKSFIDFVLSPEGQKIVLNMDFVPLSAVHSET